VRLARLGVVAGGAHRQDEAAGQRLGLRRAGRASPARPRGSR
jgi:hypothetical protein